MNDSLVPSILVLTEDSGEHGFPTMQTMVLAILQHIAPKAKLEHIETILSNTLHESFGT